MNVGKDCGKAKAAAGSAKAAVREERTLPKSNVCEGTAKACAAKSGRVRRKLPQAAVCERTAKGRMLPNEAVCGRLRKRRTPAEATVCDEGCHKQLRARRLRDAIVAESDRVRKAANEASAVCERLKGLKEVNAGKATACNESRVPKDCEKARAATGNRVPEDCSRRALLKAAVCGNTGERCQVTVWKETAKANAGNSGVCGKLRKRMVLNSGRGNRLLAVTDDAEESAKRRGEARRTGLCCGGRS